MFLKQVFSHPLLAAASAGAIKLLIFLDWFRCPFQEAFPDLPPAKEPSSYAGLKHTSVHTIVQPSMCAGYYSRGSSNQGQGLMQWLARAQVSRL